MELTDKEPFFISNYATRDGHGYRNHRMRSLAARSGHTHGIDSEPYKAATAGLHLTCITLPGLARKQMNSMCKSDLATAGRTWKS